MLAELQKSCAKKAEDWEKRQAARLLTANEPFADGRREDFED